MIRPILAWWRMRDNVLLVMGGGDGSGAVVIDRYEVDMVCGEWTGGARTGYIPNGEDSCLDFFGYLIPMLVAQWFDAFSMS